MSSTRGARTEGVVIMILGLAAAVSGYFFFNQVAGLTLNPSPTQAVSYWSVQILAGATVLILGVAIACLPKKRRLALVIGGLAAAVFIFAPLVPTSPGCPVGVACPYIRETFWGSPSHALLGVGTVTGFQRWVEIESCARFGCFELLWLYF